MERQNLCCYCNEPCSENSQACGRCFRNGPPSQIEYFFSKDEEIKENELRRDESNNAKNVQTRVVLKKDIRTTATNTASKKACSGV